MWEANSFETPCHCNAGERFALWVTDAHDARRIPRYNAVDARSEDEPGLRNPKAETAKTVGTIESYGTLMAICTLLVVASVVTRLRLFSHPDDRALDCGSDPSGLWICQLPRYRQANAVPTRLQQPVTPVSLDFLCSPWTFCAACRCDGVLCKATETHDLK